MNWDDYCAQYEKPDAKKVKTLKRSHTIMFTDKLPVDAGAGATNSAATNKASRPSPAKKSKNSRDGATKKTCNAPQVSGQWLWQTGRNFGKGKYREYEAADNAIIESAFAAKKAEVQLQLAGTAYVINFGAMEQRQKSNAVRSQLHSLQ